MDAKSVFVIACLAITVSGTPKCESFDGQNVICSAGDADYVLKRGLVSDNSQTTGITLRDCRITKLDYEAFENDVNLQYIDLSHNKLEYLDLGVLDGNIQVTYLNLSYNMLSTFPLGLFDQKPNLQVLDFKGNRLNDLKLGTFDPMQKLVHLDLSSNQLIGNNIDIYLFDKSTTIKFIDFSRNDMTNVPEMLLHSFTMMDFLNLDRCSLPKVPTFVSRPNLRTMKHLILSTNQITKLENSRTFSNLDDLEILNLAENWIEEIAIEVFYPLRKLKMLVLRNNRLKTLSNTQFMNMKKLGNLDLSYNSIEYIPVTTFSGTGLKNLNLSYNKFTYLQNNFCLELRNTGVRLNKFYFNDNPWQCACLYEVLREVKTYNIAYNKNKYNGEIAVCVTNNEFNCKRQSIDNDFFIELYNNEIILGSNK